MSDDSIFNNNQIMEILRQRLFISHDSQAQRSITSEYTIRSKRDNLTNLIFISKNILPNLLVTDEKNNTLPIMPTKYVKQLLYSFLEKSSKKDVQKLTHIIKQIDSGHLNLIWVKIPKITALTRNEVRTIILHYSPNYNMVGSTLRLNVKTQKYPSYYSLYAPEDYDFKQTSYALLENNGIATTAKRPKHVEQFRTYNASVFRISAKLDNDLAILYSFKPSSETTFSTKLGVGVLSLIFCAVLLLHITEWVRIESIMSSQVSIALFMIGGSLVLPQLTTRDSIRRNQFKLYLIPIVLGMVLLIWGLM